MAKYSPLRRLRFLRNWKAKSYNTDATCLAVIPCSRNFPSFTSSNTKSRILGLDKGASVPPCCITECITKR